MKTNPDRKVEKGNSDVGEIFLTTPQQRSLTTSLLLFEQALRKAARLLSEEDENGILYSRRSQLNLQRRLLIQKKIAIALDPASSGFFEDGFYNLRTEGKKVTSAEMVAMYADWVQKYPIVVLEDGLAEDDWEGWKLLNQTIGDKIELVGDDLFVTNVERVARGIRENVANAVLIKLNQIGTLSETIATIEMARKAGWGAMVSHRSGETVDSFIADFTVAMSTGHLKTGAPCRGERVEKYNQLMRIEEELGNSAIYAGRKAFVR